jgi:hypothetical protein
MPGEDRLTALCEQDPTRVTGIDFVQVVDPADQTVLRVFFLIDPDELVDPIVTAPFPVDMPPETVTIVSISGGERLAEVPVVRATYLEVPFNGDLRTALEVKTAEPGDFSIYRLTIVDEPKRRVDRFFNGIEFSFKQGCPSRLDCRRCSDCPEEPMVDFPVDYLARDFVSIRGALLDFAAQRYPRWTETIEADAGVMLAEVMSALGDELGYVQDRFGREAYLETLSERRSMRWHTRLVDYPIHDGRAATTLLSVEASAAGFVEAGMRVWAAPGGETPIPFEVGESLRDQRSPKTTYWIHPLWSALPVHVPDESRPCLPLGSVELFLRGEFPLATQLPPTGLLPEEFWVGRRMVLHGASTHPSLPERRHLVRLVEVEKTVDPLALEGGMPIAITRIRWEDEQALPFELCLRDTVVRGNIVPATAGETFTEHFVIAANASLPSSPVPSAVEREGPHGEVSIACEGPCDEVARERNPILFHSLTETETRGLGWVGPLRDARPEVELEEVEAATLEPADPDDPERWEYQRSLLASTADSAEYTLDDGIRRRVIGFHRIGEEVVHRDYASGKGFSVRFGDGEFGKVPADGTVFRVRYRTGPGARANVPADTVTRLNDPNPTPPFAWPTLTPLAESVTNPFAVTSGVDPEPLAVIQQLAPEAFKAEPLRAVRDEDYREIAERLLTWVQRAGASARWTGSWLSEFATADPLGSFTLSPERRRELATTLDCVRQVGREIYVRDPEFLNLDLEVRICVEESAYPGQVEERVIEALAGSEGFFHPDNFTFGTPLRRAALEAAIQAVHGVRGVEQICLRARGVTPLRPFTAMAFEVGDTQILRLQNDPRFPERGTLRVRPRSRPSCSDDGP